MAPPSEQTILVTGANGFVAGHVIRAFLEKGYKVRGTVRSASSVPKIQKDHEKYASQLSVAVVPDMTIPEAYESALDGVTGVMHTAAPFNLSAADVVKDTLEPAVKGTTSILQAVKRWAPNATRVVITSSFAAILDLGKGYRPGYTYTEKDWNPLTWEEAAVADATTAYCASKALAEQAAWDWVKTEKPGFTLSTIAPPWVFGPYVNGISDLKKLNESTEKVHELFSAKEVFPTDFAGFVDVRDLAKAHLVAFEKPEAGGQRLLIGNHFDWQTAADALRSEVPELASRVPEGKPGAGKLEQVYQLDGERARKILGIEYTPLEVTMRDVARQLLDAEKHSSVSVA